MPIPSIPAILKDLWTLSDERELDLIAAGIAFYGFLAYVDFRGLNDEQQPRCSEGP